MRVALLRPTTTTTHLIEPTFEYLLEESIW